MLGNQALKPQDDSGTENKVMDNSRNLKYNMITDWAESDKKIALMRRQFGSPRVLHKPVTQRNKHLLRCKINRSLNFDMNFSRKDNSHHISPNSSLDSSYLSMNKSTRDLSRSAKIMRALSYSDISFHHRNKHIKKSLIFDSSPSSSKSNSSDENTSVDSIINMSLHTPPDKSLQLDRNSTNSSTSSIPPASLESIDENQNQTPQHSRKVSKIQRNSSDTKRSAEKLGSPGSVSLLRSNLKERIDSIVRNIETPDLQALKQYNKSKSASCDVVASTPRNLLKEFNEEEDSPHTPENMMRFIPESMSSIKKSHKKDRLYGPVRNKNLHAKRTESLEEDDVPVSSCSDTATIKGSPKKSKNIKKTLVYNFNDSFSDGESNSNHIKQKATPENIDSDCETCEENIQDIYILPSTSSTPNYNNKRNDSCLHLASTSNIDLAEHKNGMVSFESNSDEIQDKQNNGSTTSKKHVSLLEHAHENLVELKKFHGKDLEMAIATPTDAADIQVEGSSFNSKQLQNFHMNQSESSERPITPENINSSRLLLSQFASIKKSHQKDKKKNKSALGISKYYMKNNECGKKDIDCSIENKPVNTFSKYTNEPSPLKLSPDASKKKKRFMSISLQHDKHELPCSESLFSGYENKDDEFKIYTPIRKRMSSILATVKNYVSKGETLSGEDNEQAVAADTADENGRLTPVNMSTAELLCNIDSIKMSHKKDKHDGSICKRRVLGEKPTEHTRKAEDMNFTTDSMKISEDHESPSSFTLLSNDDSLCDEMEAFNGSNMYNEDEENKERICDPQPSTSRGNVGKETSTKKYMKKSKALNTTPPNNWNSMKLMKLLHTTSIKKSHQKERKINSQSKYILMYHDYDLSDDGSIFDEEDRLTCTENTSSCRDKQ